MKLNARLEDLFRLAGQEDLLRQLADIDPDKAGMNYIDVSTVDQTQISFITTEKLKRYFKDEKMSDWANFEISSDERAFMEFEDRFGEWRANEKFASEEDRKKYGTRTKIGRFLRKFFSEDIVTTKVIEKLMSVASEGIYGFRVVEGPEIGDLYHIDNYAHGNAGELGDSCMNDDESVGFFSVYEENARMLVLYPKSHPEMIVGRAILWDNVNYSVKNRKIAVMDRIYTSSTELDYMFRQWAIDNGFYHKTKARNLIVTNGVEELDLTGNATVDIGNRPYQYYPYVDTFSGLRVREDGMIQLMAVRESDFYPLLHCTDGNTEIHDESTEECACCGLPTFNLNSCYSMSEEGKINFREYVRLCERCSDEHTILVAGEGNVDKFSASEQVVFDGYGEFLSKVRGENEKPIYYIRTKDAVKFIHRVNGKNKVSYARRYNVEDLPVEIMSRNEETGMFELYNSKPCPVCGKHHDEFKMVAIYDENRTFMYGAREVNLSFKNLPVCIDCFNEKVESGQYVNLVGKEEYRRVLNGINYSYGHGNATFVDAETCKIKCRRSECDMDILESVANATKLLATPQYKTLYTGRLIDRMAVHCISCGEAIAKDFLEENRRKIEEEEY